MFGYFDQPYQEEPVRDPGMTVDCPVCNLPLSRPVVTVSLMVPDDNRSYFYRIHKDCHIGLSDDDKTGIDSVLIDAVHTARLVN